MHIIPWHSGTIVPSEAKGVGIKLGLVGTLVGSAVGAQSFDHTILHSLNSKPALSSRIRLAPSSWYTVPLPPFTVKIPIST